MFKWFSPKDIKNFIQKMTNKEYLYTDGEQPKREAAMIYLLSKQLEEQKKIRELLEEIKGV